MLMINPVWLRSFCTLVEVGHFTRTAERLHMTQSGVSQHVRKLEEQLELLLLDRHGKRFELTYAGERLYREASDIVQALSDLDQRVREDSGYEGEVRLMSPGSVGLKLYPRLLELQCQHQNLVVDYRFAPNSDVEHAIADSQVDIGFMTSPSTLKHVNCQPIATEPLLLVTPADVTEPVWEKLLELGFIDHPDGAHHARLLLSANFPDFRHSNLFARRGFCNQIGLILEPVSRGLGFTVLPMHAVGAFGKPELVNTHELPNPVSETLYLATRRDRTMPNRMDTIITEAMKWI